MFGRTCVLVVGVLFSSGGVAVANPIASEILRARQVPETRHVQLTYGHDAGAGGALVTPTAVARDGASLALAWVALSGGFTANTGSGLTSVDATQACDCDVPLGSHAYDVTVPGMSGTIPVSVVVVNDLAPPRRQDVDAAGDGDATDDDVQVYPWDIPEPTQMQGLDCATACGGTVAEPVEDVGSTQDVAQPADTRDASGGGAETDAGGGGGCSASPSGLALVLSLLGVGLIAAMWRRRRA